MEEIYKQCLDLNHAIDDIRDRSDNLRDILKESLRLLPISKEPRLYSPPEIVICLAGGQEVGELAIEAKEA